MASVITEFEASRDRADSQRSTVYFTQDAPASHATVLAAAVLWRVAASPRKGYGRTLLRRLSHYFGPLGLGLHLKGRFRPWTGSSGPHGEQETLYDPERRVVRVLGKEYPLPGEGRTLVLLIDESGGAGGKPRVRRRILDLPTIPQRSTRISPGPLDMEESGAGDSFESAAWAALLQRDPEVQAFMGRGANDV